MDPRIFRGIGEGVGVCVFGFLGGGEGVRASNAQVSRDFGTTWFTSRCSKGLKTHAFRWQVLLNFHIQEFVLFCAAVSTFMNFTVHFHLYNIINYFGI